MGFIHFFRFSVFGLRFAVNRKSQIANRNSPSRKNTKLLYSRQDVFNKKLLTSYEQYHSSLIFKTFAGTPAITAWSGTSEMTTAPAPIRQSSPNV